MILLMRLRLGGTARIWLVIGVALACVLAAFLLPPLRQSQSYHNFADQRALWGIPNFLNVVSNAVFIVAGLMGLSVLLNTKWSMLAFVEGREGWPYTVLFLGVVWIGFGSAYYHWMPNDSTLVWDRLPMAFVFMSLVATLICERINLRAGLLLLGPLVLVGAASVEYWRWTGNLWPYAVVQYASLLLVGMILMFFPPRYTRGGDLLWVAAIYGIAKVAEALDGPILVASRLISGHTVKHLVAAFALFWILKMLWQRTNLGVETPEGISQAQRPERRGTVP